MAAFYGQGSQQQYRPHIATLIFFGFVVLCSMIVFTLRLHYLQVQRGTEYSERGQANFIQKIRMQADRGFIYDAWGNLLVDNRPSLDVYLTPAFIEDQVEIALALTTVLALTRKEHQSLLVRMKKARGLDRFVPLLVKRNISADELARIENMQSLLKLQGVDIYDAQSRRYRYGQSLGHVLGYINEIGKGELERRKALGQSYHMGDMIGRMGIEAEYESALRGQDGHKLIVSDAKGRRIHSRRALSLLGEHRRQKDPVAGHSLVLTIDIALQKRAEELFLAKGAREGALVAMDVKTGFILAMVSLPLLDPNQLASRPDPKQWRALVNDPYKPLINRTIQEHYSPGSTYKVVTALATMEHGGLNSHEKIRCPGYFNMGRMRWRCWSDRGHGMVDLKDSLKRSCDVYYYTLGHRIQLDALAQTARKMGFGQRTGIRLGIRRNSKGQVFYDEQPGINPDIAYRNRTRDKWQKGDVINNSIGQGDTNATPLQMAVAYAALANGGHVLRPQLVQRIESIQGEWLLSNQVEVVRSLQVSPENLALIHEGLCSVVNEPGGTGWYRRSRHIKVCGKTGTAQVVRLGKLRHHAIKEIDYFHRDHAWFVGYAPADDPQIVVAVVNEHGGHGSSGAAPIVVKTIEAWLELSQKRGTPAWPMHWALSEQALEADQQHSHHSEGG